MSVKVSTDSDVEKLERKQMGYNWRKEPNNSTDPELGADPKQAVLSEDRKGGPPGGGNQSCSAATGDSGVQVDEVQGDLQVLKGSGSTCCLPYTMTHRPASSGSTSPWPSRCRLYNTALLYCYKMRELTMWILSDFKGKKGATSEMNL